MHDLVAARRPELDTDDEIADVRADLAKLSDKVEHLVTPNVNENSEEVAELRAEVERLQAEVDRLHDEQQAFLGVETPDDSSPQKRAEDLRAAMIEVVRNGVNSTSGGVKWWWQEVRDQLASHGHGGFSKPVYHTAMEDAASGADAFALTTKSVTLGNGQTRDVKAIRVDPDALPSHTHRNQLTTLTPEGAATDGGETPADVSTTHE